MAQDCFQLFQRVKHLPSYVGRASDSELLKIDVTMSMKVEDVEVVSSSEMTNEDARTKWDSITMNLAYLLSSIVRIPEKFCGL